MKFITHLYHKSNSVAEFIQRLQENGLRVEYTIGIPSGVRDLDNKLYTFSKLGITPTHMYTLFQKGQINEMNNRIQQLEKLRNNQEPDNSIER